MIFRTAFFYVSKCLPKPALPNESQVVIIKKHHSSRCPHVVITHNNVIQVGDGIDKRQIHLHWVFGPMARAKAPTAKHPGLCLGYNFIKWRAQSRCFGQPPSGSGRRESLSSISHIFLTMSMMVPKNSWKCPASAVANQTQQDSWLWLSWADASKSGMCHP